VEAKRIPSDAKAAGISWRTVERAKARLGVKSRKRDFAVGWWWSLPEGSHTHTRANTVGVGGLGGLGESESPEPSCGAGSTEDRQHQKNQHHQHPPKLALARVPPKTATKTAKRKTLAALAQTQAGREFQGCLTKTVKVTAFATSG
jgi:hypothetical protein